MDRDRFQELKPDTPDTLNHGNGDDPLNEAGEVGIEVSEANAEELGKRNRSNKELLSYLEPDEANTAIEEVRIRYGELLGRHPKLFKDPEVTIRSVAIRRAVTAKYGEGAILQEYDVTPKGRQIDKARLGRQETEQRTPRKLRKLVTDYEILAKYDQIEAKYRELAEEFPHIYPDPEAAFLSMAIKQAVVARYGDVALGGFRGPRL